MIPGAKNQQELNKGLPINGLEHLTKLAIKAVSNLLCLVLARHRGLVRGFRLQGLQDLSLGQHDGA